MNKKTASFLTRRSFLGRTACSSMALTGVVNSLAHLKLVQSTLANSTLDGDYKALVVLFLFGGNDSNNMLIPRRDHPEYNNYIGHRRILGISDGRVSTSKAGISIALQDSEQIYGVHPNMQPVADLFDSGELSFVANVGSLSHPLTKEQYRSGNQTIIPPHLFSHSDQQIQWQSSIPDEEFRTGWGGRVADRLYESNNGSPVPFSISLNGVNRLQTGMDTFQYSLGTSGPLRLRGHGAGGSYDNSLNPDGSYTSHFDGQRLQAYDALHGVQAYEDLEALTYDHILEEGYSSVVRSSRKTEEILSDALAGVDDAAIDAAFPAALSKNRLAQQLKMIARVISGHESLSGVKRQIFFCGISGFDTHKEQHEAHGNLMTGLSSSLSAFNTAMKSTGNNDKVLLISHSDFTRTLNPNGDDLNNSGTDHGWGGHQIVMGGPVDGGKVIGDFPVLRSGGPSDSSGRGRWIPQISVDQYSAIAAKWMGLSDTEIKGTDGNRQDSVFPNLYRFDDPLSSDFKGNYLL